MREGNARVVFMGSPEFAVPSLRALHESEKFQVELVVTQPDKPVGRGRKPQPTPVRREAESLGIAVIVKGKGGYRELYDRIVSVQPDFIVVAAFGMILKKDLLELPKYGCVNLHASILPKYRGVSPVAAALLSGDEVTGCTSMLMDEGIDTGDILLVREIKIEREDTTGSLTKRLSLAGADLIIETLGRILRGALTPRKQDHARATYTKKIKKNDGLMDWTKNADHLERFVRAMLPWPTAFTFFRGKRVILLKTGISGMEPYSGSDADQNTEMRWDDRAGKQDSSGKRRAGGVISLNPLVVKCGSGALEIKELKVQGKKAMSAEAFVRGYRLKIGDAFTSEPGN